MKKCTKCETEKQLEEFHREKRVKDGRNSVCKNCRNEIGKKHRKENPEQNKEYKKTIKQKY